MLLSQLCLNSMFMRCMEAVDRRKNCCLNKGFDNSLNKMCRSSVESQRSRGGKVRGDSFLSRGLWKYFTVATDYGRVRASIADRGGLCVTLPKLRHCDSE